MVALFVCLQRPDSCYPIVFSQSSPFAELELTDNKYKTEFWNIGILPKSTPLFKAERECFNKYKF